MDALEISVPGIVARLDQGLEACLHEGADTAAKDSLLTEEVGLGLGAEGGLQDAGAGGADACGICQSHVQGVAGSVLLDGDQGGCALACLVLAADGVAGSLGGDHGHVDISGGIDQTEMDVEAVGEHQHIAGLEVGLDVLLVHGRLLLIIDQDHDDISHLCSLGSIVNGQALCLRLCL